MITLSNGDRWIIDESELTSDDNGVPNKLKEISAREFVEKLLSNEFFPRKLVNHEDFDEGYWCANFDAHKEVLGTIAVWTKNLEFCVVHEMPWGEVIVVYLKGDYSVEKGFKAFHDKKAYMDAVSL